MEGYWLNYYSKGLIIINTVLLFIAFNNLIYFILKYFPFWLILDFKYLFAPKDFI